MDGWIIGIGTRDRIVRIYQGYKVGLELFFFTPNFLEERTINMHLSGMEPKSFGLGPTNM